MRVRFFAACLLLSSLAVLVRAAAAPVGVTADARAVQPGELVVLTIAAGDADAVSVRAFGHIVPAYRVSPSAWQALVGIDLAVKPGSYPAAVDARTGTSHAAATYMLNVRPHRFPVRTLTVDPAFVNPPPGVTDRIAREAAELERLWHDSAGDRLWSGPFVEPVPGATASRFGSRSVFNGEARSPHSGADFASPTGTPILAPNAGRVVLARDLYFSGNTVIIDHGLGLFSLLAHLSSIGVQEGDRVLPGHEIGKVGATGRVTGPHLHWAIRAGGARIDPLSVLALLGAHHH